MRPLFRFVCVYTAAMCPITPLSDTHTPPALACLLAVRAAHDIITQALLDGTVDALYIYADQIHNFVNANDALAAGFGTTFAYVQTGLDNCTRTACTHACITPTQPHASHPLIDSHAHRVDQRHYPRHL